MDKWKHRFYSAQCYARRESGCMKVAVGAIWVPDIYERAKIYDAVFASNVNSEGYSCKEHNECYKAIALKGLSLEKTGDEAGAIRCMQEALDIVPGNSRYIHEYNRMQDNRKL